jgi:hypothetical protein
MAAKVKPTRTSATLHRYLRPASPEYAPVPEVNAGAVNAAMSFYGKPTK